MLCSFCHKRSDVVFPKILRSEVVFLQFFRPDVVFPKILRSDVVFLQFFRPDVVYPKILRSDVVFLHFFRPDIKNENAKSRRSVISSQRWDPYTIFLLRLNPFHLIWFPAVALMKNKYPPSIYRLQLVFFIVGWWFLRIMVTMLIAVHYWAIRKFKVTGVFLITTNITIWNEPWTFWLKIIKH